MKEKNDLDDELREHAPFLSPLKKGDDGFRGPADYFDNLESEVFRQLDAIGARPNPAVFAGPRKDASWWQVLQGLWQPRLALAFAGVVAVALAAWWYFDPKPAVPDTPALAAELSADDAEAYLMDNLLELDPEQIALVLPPDELPPVSLDPSGDAASDTPKTPRQEIQISPDDLDDILRDMSDEELEKLL